jgi:hypothetical protein
MRQPGIEDPDQLKCSYRQYELNLFHKIVAGYRECRLSWLFEHENNMCYLHQYIYFYITKNTVQPPVGTLYP